MVVFYNNYNSSNSDSIELLPTGQKDQTLTEQLADLRHALTLAQAENRAHQARFTMLMQAAGEAVLLTTAQGRVLATNQLCRELFGLPADPGLHGPELDVTAAVQHCFREPAGFGACTRAWRAARAASATGDFVLADGRVLECRYAVPADEDLGHLLTFCDVTAVRRAAALEQELAGQRAMFTTLLDQLKVEVAVFDADARYRFVNARCFREQAMLEWIIGKNDFELGARRGRPDELALRRQRLFAEAVQTHTEVIWEEEFTSIDGPQQMRRHFIPVFWPDGTLRMVVGTGSNITRRRQAEKKLIEQRAFYQYALDHIPCDIGVFDAEGRYLLVNATGIKDAAKREWVIGKDNFEYCAEYGHPMSLAEERQARIMEAFSGNALVTYEESFDRPGGMVHQLRCLQPVYHADGTPQMVVAYGLNITDRVNTERQLRHAKLAAESAVRARELFLANMSHEIRTPMNAILGMSQLLAKTALAPDQDSYRQAIATSAEHLLVIINDILDLSKLEAGKMALEHVGFTPAHLLAEVEQTLHYKAVEKGLCLSTEVAAAVPRVLLGDPYRIRQVLLNLAGNAIKFTEKGRVTIACDYVPATDGTGPGEVIFRVVDTGVGIEAEFVQSMFNEFSQEDSSVTRKFGGTGLGLSICRNLLKLMGSEVQLESEKNVGTQMEFALRLPVGSALDLTPKEVLPADSPIRQDLRNKQVLLVEDNRFNRQIAKTFLNHAHVQVTEAEHGAVAVELAQHQHFDLILMDIQMPVMDGYAATALLRQQLGLATPIVALTANAITGEREKCLAAGMDGYLTKPFKEEELLRIVSRFVLRPAEAADALPVALAAMPSAAVPVTNPLYAVDELLKVGQGDLDFVAFMLETFVESCEDALAGLAQGMQTQSLALLKATAHTLAPSLVHLGALHLLPPVKALDQWPGSFDPETLRPLTDTIAEGLREIMAQIKQDTQV
ncbi:signal transduction histidine kinase/AmiR/NasT family two-component response regulator [Hymenobacter sp. UYAg731]